MMFIEKYDGGTGCGGGSDGTGNGKAADCKNSLRAGNKASTIATTAGLKSRLTWT